MKLAEQLKVYIEEAIADTNLFIVEIKGITVKRAMIKASRKVYALAIAEKLNSVRKMRVCNLSEIDGIITELNPQNPILAPYHNLKIQII